jgi:hypothetical protein
MRPWFLTCLVLLACSGDGKKSFGDHCQTADECEGGVCSSAVCSVTCTQNSECPELHACGTQADGSRLCLPACESYAGYGYACIDGAPVACEQVDDPGNHCGACGCADGQYCDSASDVCQPARAIGEECSEHLECASGNCGFREGQVARCLVGRDQACTPGNGDCFACDPVVDGDICAQTCRSDADCYSNEMCLGSQGSGFFVCRQRCQEAQCPAFWPCRENIFDDYCEPARRCDENIDCGLANECVLEYGLCGILF